MHPTQNLSQKFETDLKLKNQSETEKRFEAVKKICFESEYIKCGTENKYKSEKWKIIIPEFNLNVIPTEIKIGTLIFCFSTIYFFFKLTKHLALI